MGPVLVLRPIRGVAESLGAARVLAHVRFFTCVRPEMSLEILQPRVRFVTALKLQSEWRKK